MDENLVRIRHARSEKDFSFLKLEEDEYVEFAFKRAKICNILIVGAVAGLLAIVLLAFLVVLLGQHAIDAGTRNFLYVVLFVIIVFGVLAGVVAMKIFQGNQMYITNKHVVQFIKKAPFVKSVNIIDLLSVEDASFHKVGFAQNFLNYGTFRLSTVGDETTYTFPYSDISAHDLNEVSKLITTAKERVRKED